MDNPVHTIDEFCTSHRICRATFYNLLKRGDGPAIMKIGSRTLITSEAAANWRQRMEQMAASNVPETTKKIAA